MQDFCQTCYTTPCVCHYDYTSQPQGWKPSVFKCAVCQCCPCCCPPINDSTDASGYGYDEEVEVDVELCEDCELYKEIIRRLLR